MDKRYNEAVVNFLLGLYLIVLNIFIICSSEQMFIIILGIVLLICSVIITIVNACSLLDLYVDRKIDEYLKITEQMENFDE